MNTLWRVAVSFFSDETLLGGRQSLLLSLLPEEERPPVHHPQVPGVIQHLKAFWVIAHKAPAGTSLNRTLLVSPNLMEWHHREGLASRRRKSCWWGQTEAYGHEQTDHRWVQARAGQGQGWGCRPNNGNPGQFHKHRPPLASSTLNSKVVYSLFLLLWKRHHDQGCLYIRSVFGLKIPEG